jgi:hypothetical protein
MAAYQAAFSGLMLTMLLTPLVCKCDGGKQSNGERQSCLKHLKLG